MTVMKKVIEKDKQYILYITDLYDFDLCDSQL